MLVAIAIPIFTSQLEKSREATDIANCRSGYAAVMTEYLQTGKGCQVEVTAQQKVSGWLTDDPSISTDLGSGSNKFSEKITLPDKGANGKWTIKADDAGKITIS